MKRLVLPILMLWFAGIAVVAPVLAAGPALLPAVPLQAATSAPSPSPAAVDPGNIAYVRRSTHDIHLISPDGTGDRVLWTAPLPLTLYPAYDLAWRPDGRELAFSSEHEYACSWYESDVYAIGYDGTGYRRVSNAPACAGLAALPKGTVTVDVYNSAGSFASVYVAGAPGLKFAESGTMTFENVADFGPGVLQPAVGIYGERRTEANPPVADVLPGQTVAGGILYLTEGSGATMFGTGKVSWKADGSALAYGMRSATRISQLPVAPPYGSTGEPLPVVENTSPNLVAWGPAGKENQYLYSSTYNTFHEGLEGIYLNTVGDPSGGTMLVDIDGYYSAQVVYDIEWLPDGTGFLFSMQYVDFEIYFNIFEYNFESEEITQLTALGIEEGARGFSISPDGQYVVFERADRFDTTSSLWIMNRDGSGLHKLADDAGRPAWGQSATGPVAPTVEISLSGTNVDLSWADNPANDGGYIVWYSEAPFFLPPGATSVALPAGSTGWTHTAAAGNPAHNYYYLVQGVSVAEAVSAPSNRTGAFTLSLTPGTP